METSRVPGLTRNRGLHDNAGDDLILCGKVVTGRLGALTSGPATGATEFHNAEKDQA